MFGQISAYDGNLALTVDVTLTGGSGTIADWEIVVQGPRGPVRIGCAGRWYGREPLVNTSSGTASWTTANAEGLVEQGKHEIPVMARALEPTPTNGCAALAVGETTTNDVPFEYLAFDDAVAESCYFRFIAPKSADESAGFLSETCFGRTGRCHRLWRDLKFEMLARGNDEAKDTAFGTAVSVSDTGGTDDDEYFTGNSTVITPGGSWSAGDVITLKITRDVTDAGDTLDIDARLEGFKLVITTDASNDA